MIQDVSSKQIAFEESEFRRRLSAVQREIAGSGLDALLSTTTENIYYLTGYQTFGGAQQALIVPAEGDPFLVLRYFESHLVAYTSWLDASRHVATWDDSDDPHEAIVRALGDTGLDGKRIGLETRRGGLSVALYRAVADRAEVVDATDVIEGVRAVKSQAELAVMRQAARYTEAGIRAAFDAVTAGASENDVAAASYDAMVRAGSEYMANDPIITAGPRSGVPHTTFCRARIAPGDPVLIELGANHHRYFAPLMRTAVAAPASDTVRALYDACVASLEAALDVIRPGITSGEAHAACQRVIDARGYRENFRKRLGYGVGIGWQSWSEGHIVSLRADDRTELKAGMTFHLPPALRIVPEVGVGLSETIVVTETGCECLLDVPRELVVH